MLKKWMTILSVIMLVQVLTAQSIEVRVDRDTILAGNNFTVTYTLKNVDAQSGVDITPISRLELVAGPNVMSSIQIINGDQSSTMTYSYVYHVGEEGTYTVPSIRVDDISSEPLVIEVYPNPTGIVQRPKQSQFFEFRQEYPSNGSFDDFWGRRNTPKEKEAPKKNTRPLKRI